MWNMGIVYTTGYVIYPGLSFDSVLAWAEGLAIFPVGILLWFLIYWATNWKIRKFLRNHVDKNVFINDMDEDLNSSFPNVVEAR